jgi:hypothetical protein
MWAGGEGISSSFIADELKRLQFSEVSSNKSTIYDFNQSCSGAGTLQLL